jgi:hypothetical protein
MSREVDLSKPLSDKDRKYLQDRSDYYAIQENDRVHKKGQFAEDYEEEFKPNYSVAAPPIEPGSEADNPPQFVGQRPYGVDRGVWGGSTGLSEQEALAGESGEPHHTQEQTEEADPEDLTVDELKDELRERELPLDGNKADLVKRLKKALKEEQ